MREFLNSKTKSESRRPGLLKDFSREDLATMLGQWGMVKGVEVGVAEGNFSECLMRANADLHLTCVDTWAVGEDLRSRAIGQKVADSRYREAKERLNPLGCRLLKMSSLDGADEFEDESLDFVYIDACHEFDYVMQDIIVWAKKVRPCGIVAGHDYHSRIQRGGVIEAVLAYTGVHDIDFWITSDRDHSWIWIK